MKNITVSVPDTVYLRARVWAAERSTSVSAVVAHLLENLPQIRHAAHLPQRPAGQEPESGGQNAKSPLPPHPSHPVQ